MGVVCSFRPHKVKLISVPYGLPYDSTVCVFEDFFLYEYVSSVLQIQP